MEFCGKEITDAMLIENTLSTSPVSALMVAKNYRIDVNVRRITRFHELIRAMNVAEKHDNILVKNYNSKSVEISIFRNPIIVAPLREGAKSETLILGILLDILIHIIALLGKVTAKIGEHGTEEVNVEREREATPLAMLVAPPTLRAI